MRAEDWNINSGLELEEAVCRITRTTIDSLVTITVEELNNVYCNSWPTEAGDSIIDYVVASEPMIDENLLPIAAKVAYRLTAEIEQHTAAVIDEWRLPDNFDFRVEMMAAVRDKLKAVKTKAESVE